MKVVYLKRGDTARKITDSLSLDGAPIDLSGTTVVLVWAPAGEAVQRKTASIGEDPSLGQVSYTMSAEDVATAGVVRIEWEITFADQSVLTVPTLDDTILRILPDLG
jgi:hypothetical protein